MRLEIARTREIRRLREPAPPLSLRRETACRLRAERSGKVDRARRHRRAALRRGGTHALCVSLPRPGVADWRRDRRPRRNRTGRAAPQGTQEYTPGRGRRRPARRRARPCARRRRRGRLSPLLRTRLRSLARGRRRDAQGGRRRWGDPARSGVRPAQSSRCCAMGSKPRRTQSSASGRPPTGCSTRRSNGIGEARKAIDAKELRVDAWRRLNADIEALGSRIEIGPRGPPGERGRAGAARAAQALGAGLERHCRGRTGPCGLRRSSRFRAGRDGCPRRGASRAPIRRRCGRAGGRRGAATHRGRCKNRDRPGVDCGLRGDRGPLPEERRLRQRAAGPAEGPGRGRSLRLRDGTPRPRARSSRRRNPRGASSDRSHARGAPRADRRGAKGPVGRGSAGAPIRAGTQRGRGRPAGPGGATGRPRSVGGPRDIRGARQGRRARAQSRQGRRRPRRRGAPARRRGGAARSAGRRARSAGGKTAAARGGHRPLRDAVRIRLWRGRERRPESARRSRRRWPIRRRDFRRSPPDVRLRRRPGSRRPAESATRRGVPLRAALLHTGGAPRACRYRRNRRRISSG